MGADPVMTEERRSFERDGFLVIRALCDPEETARLSAWIDELASRSPTPGREMFYLDDDVLRPGHRLLSRIERFVEHHDGLRGFLLGPPLVDLVGALLGEAPVLFKEKVNLKLPGGDGFKPHQDIQAGWGAYAPYFLSVLVAVDRSTPENGCLELAGGHHRRGLIGEEWRPLEGAELDGISFHEVPMEPGDAAVFDCFVPHRSGPNRTADPRRNLYVTYNRRSEGDHRERYFADKRQNYPPDNERAPGEVHRFRV